MEQEHKRRVRYKGTHPRSYREKYKELNPEKYQDDVAKIIQSGKTPAGMHISIMVNEILEFLDIQPSQIGLDATLGYGGHTRRMLEKLQGRGHMYATDVDPIESEKTRARLEALGYGPEILTIRRMNFADLDQVAPDQKFDFILADLGVSSMQIDNPERGFIIATAITRPTASPYLYLYLSKKCGSPFLEIHLIPIPYSLHSMHRSSAALIVHTKRIFSPSSSKFLYAMRYFIHMLSISSAQHPSASSTHLPKII